MKVGKFLGKIWCFQKDFFSQGSKALHIQRHKKMQRWCCSIWSEKRTSYQYHGKRGWQKRTSVCWVPAQLCAKPVLLSPQYHPAWGAQPSRAGPAVTSVSQKKSTRYKRCPLAFLLSRCSSPSSLLTKSSSPQEHDCSSLWNHSPKGVCFCQHLPPSTGAQNLVIDKDERYLQAKPVLCCA